MRGKTGAINLGDQVRCRVTGFEGHVTARVEYLSGAVEFAVTPPMKDGVYPKPVYLDEHRLEPTGQSLNLPMGTRSMGFKFSEAPDGRVD